MMYLKQPLSEINDVWSWLWGKDLLHCFQKMPGELDRTQSIYLGMNELFSQGVVTWIFLLR